jgi:hypothetical protein
MKTTEQAFDLLSFPSNLPSAFEGQRSPARRIFNHISPSNRFRFGPTGSADMRILVVTLLALLAPTTALAAGYDVNAGYGLTAKYANVHEVGNKFVYMREIQNMAPSLFDQYATPPASPKFNGLSAFNQPICQKGCGFANTALAASPKWILEGAGSGFAVYSTTGHLAPGWPVSAATLFQIPSPQCDPGQPYIGDPRAVYDPNDHRFWASVTTYETGTCPQQSLLWIAVSQTNDPRGAWNVYAINADVENSGGAIQSNELGFDNEAVYFGCNFYDLRDYFTEVFFASKARMESGQSINPGVFYKFKGPKGYLLNSVQPIETETPTARAPGVEYLMNTNNPVFGCQPYCSVVDVWAIANPLTTPTLSGFTLSTFDKYSAPPSIVEPGYNLGTSDNGIDSAPVFTAARGDGLIAFSLVTGGGSDPSAASVLWGEVHPTINASGTLTDVTEFQAGYLREGRSIATFDPAVMASNDGSLWIVAEQSSPSVYPRIVIGVQRATDPLGRFEKMRALKIGVGPPNGGSGELGLYNAAAVDGFSQGRSHVWLAGQYIVKSTWTTYLGRDI